MTEDQRPGTEEKNQEIEAKFYVRSLAAVEARLKTLGATFSRPRTHEYNLRFDTPEGDLTRTVQVLRLRKDLSSRMTYKGPGVVVRGVRLRKEIEFEVSDFENARALLEALGYQVSMIYEKYRAVYALDGVHVTLDEMPFGHFVEVEGPDIAGIQTMSQNLELDWETRINSSYAALFETVCQNLRKHIPNLTFDDFAGIEVSPIDLGVSVADRPTKT